MKLIASMPARNELGRYLRQTVTHALTYCDEVCVLDDGSTDGSREWLEAQDRVSVRTLDNPGWAREDGDEHVTRQALFEHTMEGEPTHVLCIDADEFVPGGIWLNALLAGNPDVPVWTLRVVELWRSDPPAIRVDGGWRPRAAPILYQAPQVVEGAWHAHERRCACPREPVAVSQLYAARRFRDSHIDLLHCGWANMTPEERLPRARRYMDFDQGEYHASEHIESILWPDEKVRLRPYDAITPEVQALLP
jgi:glycosyltransferase involved in cell wall biosynthesis